MTQENYEKTRVGGKLDFVKSNLERLCAYKKAHGLIYPIIEAQYLKFSHNLDQLPMAKSWLKDIGVDKLVDFYGTLHNYTVDYPENFTVFKHRLAKRTPLCYWPYFFIVINYNGDVVPCCWFRMYAHCSSDKNDKTTVIGNVFEQSIKEIWNSEKYRLAREMVSNPGRALEKYDCSGLYCYDCPFLFDTDWRKNHRVAPEWHFEDLYEMINGKPVRRPDGESIALRNKRLEIEG
jgi:MoaA/NifB/PqqE/SkfB family radical SAM enzyme